MFSQKKHNPQAASLLNKNNSQLDESDYIELKNLTNSIGKPSKNAAEREKEETPYQMLPNNLGTLFVYNRGGVRNVKCASKVYAFQCT